MKLGSSKRYVPWALGAAAIAALIVLGTTLPLYWVFLLSTVAVSAIVARSIGIVTQQVGMITLCQMSFAALGGWAVSWASLTWPTAPFPVLVVIAGVLIAPIGLLFGFITGRVRGVEFAVVTLGFAAALDLVIRQRGFPGVGTGTAVVPAEPFTDARWFFALSWACFVVLSIGIGVVSRSSIGSGWAAVKSSERAAAALGIGVVRSKAIAFALGALCAGTAGGLLAGLYGLLTTSVFTPLTSMVHLATAVLCGASVLGGAVLAGVLSVFMPEVLRRCGLPLDVGNVLLAVGAFDVLRRGNGGIAEQAMRWWEGRRFAGARVSCDISLQIDAAIPQHDAEPGTASIDAAPSLDISGLTVAYGADTVLERVDLRVLPGQVHALIGPNGAGKTTLVDAVTGFLPRYTGTTVVGGVALDRCSVPERVRHGLRRTFQQGRTVSELTVDAYLRLAGAAAPVTVAAQEALRNELREYFGLPSGEVPIRLMDVGSRRVLEVAGALASAPTVLILDEPAAGLGEDVSAGLAVRVRAIPERFGCAVLLIEHDMGFVRAASTQTTALDEGRVIVCGDTSDVLKDDRVVAAYLGQEVRA